MKESNFSMWGEVWARGERRKDRKGNDRPCYVPKSILES